MMKNIWFMLLTVCTMFAFSACSDDDEKNPTNPVQDAKVPATAEIGTKLTVNGTGFDKAAGFTFKNATSSTEATEIETSTSGATMTIPMSLSPGNYTLVLKQNGEWELGAIELTAASLPIDSPEVPTIAFTGQELAIEGSGYNETSKIYLEDATNTRTELIVNNYTNGLICSVPSTIAPNSYKIVLAQNGGEWTLAEEINIVKGKRLNKIAFINDYTALMPAYGEQTIFSFELIYEDNIPTQAIYTEGIATYDITYGDRQISFTIKDVQEDEFYMGYMSHITLTQDNNTITSGELKYIAVNYEDEVASGDYNCRWNYENNYLTNYIGAKTDAYDREYTYEKGNLISINEVIFNYDEAKSYSYPGVDIAALLYQVNALNTFEDVAWYYAVLTGKAGEKSAQLPVKMQSDEECELEYTFDDNGYVTQVRYLLTDGQLPCYLKFQYEDIE